MNPRFNASIRSTLALGALLLLAAGLTGCGVGLPTSPDVQSTEIATPSHGRTASAASGEFDPNGEIVDSDGSSNGMGGDSGEIQPFGEIIVPSPSRYDSFKGAGKAIGHQKNKWSTRN